jgi:carbamoyl-phosphate synthase large subunit
MPRRTDLRRILLLGSGPIVIGQACEFDYSGTQACKALRAEGFEVVLVNSNPASIMTDPDMADRTYIEPLTPEVVARVIEIEQPDALLPTMGGQTALNLAVTLAENGTLAKHGVELIGANLEAIQKAEDRLLFKQAMARIGVAVCPSGIANTLEEAEAVGEAIGSYPRIIRPAFTLGGSGGGIAYNPEEFRAICLSGLDASPVSQILIEQSLLGWKEFELEVMRDTADNVVIVCSIENLDPMGVHTGDSITVAPAQTLTDREYQRLRDQAIAIIREIGVDTGGSNIQFAINPANGAVVVIEMNPRVSRSSALASKATGFPIAKIAARLAVGYTLDEIVNDITGATPACFEPTIDYVVTKIPRFAFEKFQGSPAVLTTSMKSVGEAMAIGRCFEESFQKALRSLETGHAGWGCDRPDAAWEPIALERALRTATPERIFAVRAALLAGRSDADIHRLSAIDPWFLAKLRGIVAAELRLLRGRSLAQLEAPALLELKQLGFSDRQIAWACGSDELTVRRHRQGLGVTAVFKTVDTCAAEFASSTPYHYSSYERPLERLNAAGDLERVPPENEVQPEHRRKVMILGGGPNRIGQGIEFDYCCVHASFALREAGFATVMVNSNPETVSTDYDTSDRLYFEPLTFEDVLNVIEAEKPEGVIVQFGGQTPLKLAIPLLRWLATPEGLATGTRIWGTSPESIDTAEDREQFEAILRRLEIRQPRNGLARSEAEALAVAERIGYPVVVRPSYVLGGRGDGGGVRPSRAQPLHGRGGDCGARPPGADRSIPGKRHRGGCGCPLRRHWHGGDRRCHGAHRARRHPLGRFGLLSALRQPQRCGPGHHPPVEQGSGPGPGGARPDQPAVRRAAGRRWRGAGVHHRGQSARLAHGAVCGQGHRRAPGQIGQSGDGRPEPGRVGVDGRARATAAGGEGGGVALQALSRLRHPAGSGDAQHR